MIASCVIIKKVHLLYADGEDMEWFADTASGEHYDKSGNDSPELMKSNHQFKSVCDLLSSLLLC